MAVFPSINSTSRAMYPNGVTFEMLTNQTNAPAGGHIAFQWRTEPLARYTLAFKNLLDAEAATIRAFFRSMQGRFGQFQYIDPTGNLLQDSEDFTQPTWTKACAVIGSTADPAGGAAATILSGDGSGLSKMEQIIALDPGVSGTAGCFSVWLKSVSGSLAFNIYLTDGTTTINLPCALTTTGWSRVSIPWVFGASGAVTVGIGGNSTWTGTTQVAVLWPMLSMTPGAAPYLKTPGFYALRPNCRFDQDAFDIQYRDVNQTDITLKIAEISTAVQRPFLLISMPGFGKCLYIGAGSPPTGWETPSYDDSAWVTSVAGAYFHWYFTELGAAYISDTLANRNPNDWMLCRFPVSGAMPGTALTLRAAADDFIELVYFNGTLVYTGPSPGDESLTIIPLGASTGSDVVAIAVSSSIYAISIEFVVVG